ncbi:hypothetical protein [Streptomyces sp. NPDC001980]|uniref:hypothetical protein n=1 Tax=Streptomyces sp. NPDC001980 TaxID=3157126 RepID=UPI00332795FB
MARSPRRPAQPLSEHFGDLVRVALMEARPAGLSTVQLVAATRLKKSQVQRGVRHLRDVGAAENLTRVIWRRKDGYLFSDDPADWIEYEKKQLAQVLGPHPDDHGHARPHLARCSDDEWARPVDA